MTIFWLLLLAIAVAFGWVIRHQLRKWNERKQAEEERFAKFMQGSTGVAAPKAAAPTPRPTPAPPVAAPPAAARDDLTVQKMLFDAAHKAGEAGEPALAVQLYARLIARFPAGTLTDAARAAVEAQKKKLAKA